MEVGQVDRNEITPEMFINGVDPKLYVSIIDLDNRKKNEVHQNSVMSTENV